jgi:NitT/TauT family transport system substrate-binding protein
MNIACLRRAVVGLLAVPLLALMTGAGAQAQQYEIVVTNFGVSANGMPFAVALEKNLFKAEGVDVKNILTSAGGGTTLRNMMAAGVPYAEINPGAAIGAIQAGVDLKIVSDNVLTVGEFAWFVRADSNIKSFKDVKGVKVGFNNPRSTSVAVLEVVLNGVGLKKDDVQMVRTGGFGETLTALDGSIIDVAAITEPLLSKYKSKYRTIAVASEILPPLDNVVGVALVSKMAEHGNFIRAVIRARRKAVEFMLANPDEASAMIAKHYSTIEPQYVKAAVHNLVKSKTDGVPYFGTGQIHLKGLARMVEAQKAVGAIVGDVNLDAIIDTQFLPDDIKAIVK